MKAPVIFGLVVRCAGVFLLYQTVHALVGVLNMFLTTMPHLQQLGAMGRPGFSTILNVLLLGCAAAWFLFGAPPIQQWAYPDPNASLRGPAPAGQPPAVYNGSPCVSCDQAMPQGAKTCPHCGWTQL